MTASDDQLMNDLRRVLDAVDGPFTRSADAGRSAFTWRTIDAELAELVYDSSVHDSDALVLRTPTSAPRRLEFRSGDITVEVEIDRDLIGQIMPAGPADVELHEGTDTPRTARADELGVFRIPDVQRGPTALTIRAPDGSWRVRTEWTAV